MILSGKQVAEALLQHTKTEANKLKNKPTLAIVTSNTDEASKVYIRNKVKACEECGMSAHVITMPEHLDTAGYLALISLLNQNKQITGIIVQLPLPEHIDEKRISASIAPEKDIDGFGKLAKFAPCTPRGILHILDYYKGKNFLKGKSAVVIGRSEIVGKPMANLLLDRDATVTICHSHTQNLKHFTQNADVVVVAVGKPKFLTKDMVKPGATIIDVGINRENGKLCGDCDFEPLSEICDITPVPGGVGATTVATLVSRLPVMAKEQNKTQTSEMAN